MTTTLPESSPAPVRPEPIASHRRVVVGMDEAPVSVAALRFAATEAAYRGGDVLAVHVWHYPAMWGFPVWPEQTDLGRHILNQMQETVDAVLAERAQAGEPVVPITVEVVEGVTVAALRDAAHGAALLVLGARHHNRILGSVSQACTSHSPCPVVIVPPQPPQPE